MKISELIQTLQEYQKEYGDLPLVHAKDGEGNAYHLLHSVLPLAAEDLTEYYIELVDVDDETPVNCVVFWP